MVKKTRNKKELDKLNLGSSTTDYPETYSPNILESIATKSQTDLWVSLVCPEFTSLCPKTNQPDFAKIFINYIPSKLLVESKSLKLYLFSFRNHGDFHEDCIETICEDLFKLLKPNYIEVVGEFTPRGGIAIWPFSVKSSGNTKYKKLKDTRFANYHPGKYSVTLSKIY